VKNRQRRVVDAEALPDAFEQPAAVVGDEQLKVARGLPHRHHDRAAAAVVDGVVDQFGERMLGDAGNVVRQLETRREVARPGQVLVEPGGQRVAAHDLAQQSGSVPRPARRTPVDQPLRVDQLPQRAARAAAAHIEPQGDALGQRSRMQQRFYGDPGGDGR
jgi:hypothetical protein